MRDARNHDPNPRRVAAGRANQAKRRGLTEPGRERLRQSALAHRPWTHTRGPTTPAGKARSAANGRVRQVGPLSVREMRTKLKEVRCLISTIRNAVSEI
jgi:hypothetical protein